MAYDTDDSKIDSQDPIFLFMPLLFVNQLRGLLIMEVELDCVVISSRVCLEELCSSITESGTLSFLALTHYQSLLQLSI